MDLHSSENYWSIKNGIPVNFSSLKKNLHCDIAIIGAGITGAIIADKLCKLGYDVIMLDKRHAAFGSTSASTALLQYEVDTPLHQLIKKRGIQDAVQSYKLCVEAIQGIKALCQNIPEADFHLRPSFQFCSFKSHLKDHQKEQELRRHYSISKTQWLSEAEINKIFKFKKPGGIYSSDGACIDPFQLTYKLITKHSNKNLRLFDNTEVLNIEHRKNDVLLICNSPFKVKAKKLIIACGYESQNFINKKVEIPNTTYAILSEPLDKSFFWHKESLIWETANPYLYLRTTGDNRILVGGKDDENHNPKKRDLKLPQKRKALEKSFQELYPGIPFKTDFSWAGLFCKTKDGLPYIGEIPERKHTYFALGFGGNGITYSYIASLILADLIQGKVNDNAKIFEFNR